MSHIRKIAEFLATELESSIPELTVEVAHSKTNWGESSYVTWRHPLIKSAGRKFAPKDEIRISDHPCGAKHDLMNHLYSDKEVKQYVASAIAHIAKIKAGNI